MMPKVPTPPNVTDFLRCSLSGQVRSRSAYFSGDISYPLPLVQLRSCCYQLYVAAGMATLSIAGLEALLEELGLGTPIPDFPQSSPLRRPIDIYRAYLADTASVALQCDRHLTYEAVQSANIRDNSDLALVLPKLKLKSDKPKELAKECLVKVRAHETHFKPTPLLQLPLPDGVHLRFIFSTSTLPRLILPYIDDRKSEYGRNPSLGLDDVSAPNPIPKKVVVEFSSPNLASEFTAAHLRSTILGAQIANLHESMGWDVVRLNYLGDWGKELGLLAVGWGRFGSEEAFQKDPMGHLLEVYEKISELFRPEKEASKRARDEGQDTATIETRGIFAERDAFFKRMEEREPDAVDLWKRIRDVSVGYYSRAYARLNIEFDEFSGESQVSPESIEEVESILRERGVYEESGGSWIIDFSKHGPKSLGVSVLRGRTGSTSYLLRDIAAVFDRDKRYSFDKMIYVVTSEQDIHFSKVFQAVRYMGRGDLADKLEHVSFAKTQGLSPQLGKVHLLGDIIDQSISAVRDTLGAEQDTPIQIENTEEAANMLGISALIAQDALHKRANGYSFNTKTLCSFGGESGLSLQASYAKINAKINESDLDGVQLADMDLEYLQEDPWTEVIRLMAQYPDVTHAAYRTHEPSVILAYLFRLTEELANCLDDDDEGEDEGEGDGPRAPEEPGRTRLKVPEPPEAILAQAMLYKIARQVMDNGMSILGLTPVMT
ncbi:hypothetical protein DL769_005611 [Monosporascus sp. CRB-8-3]|nr:hypothetical protein DL769_005611 [Monosporascus sp. CRB-8-3]